MMQAVPICRSHDQNKTKTIEGVGEPWGLADALRRLSVPVCTGVMSLLSYRGNLGPCLERSLTAQGGHCQISARVSSVANDPQRTLKSVVRHWAPEPTSSPAVACERGVLDIGQVHHDVLRCPAGQPPKFFRRAHVDFEVRDVGWHEHEIAFR
jgi:hypothetical protein